MFAMYSILYVRKECFITLLYFYRPMDLLLNPMLRLNGEYYVTKQILPALDRVFSLVGVDVTKW